jgi:hypothetical protein
VTGGPAGSESPSDESARRNDPLEPVKERLTEALELGVGLSVLSVVRVRELTNWLNDTVNGK